MNIQNLIEVLQQFDPLAEVVGTWEGQIEQLEIYQAADGRVMIDSDHGFYKTMWLQLKCEVCGNNAVRTPFKAAKPVCYEHWYTFASEEEKATKKEDN